MIKNKDENVKTYIKFYDKKAEEIDKFKDQQEATKRLADHFKLITLKKECLCFNTITTPLKKLTVDEKSSPNLNFIKKKKNKLVNCPKNQLENLLINNDLLKMYS